MKILVVEDELDTLSEIVDYLRTYDDSLEVEACSNPLVAIRACQSTFFDAALLDIQMPEMTGFELAECLSAMTPDISLVFITAYNNYATEAFDLNAVDYILKPIRQDRFDKALDKIKRDLPGKSREILCSQGEVNICAFGKMVVSCCDQVLKWRRLKSSEIFGFLLHQNGAPVHKEKLCEMMWPEYDPQKALAYLQTIMYQLRKNLSEICSDSIVIEYADHCYRLVLNNVSYDVDLFLAAFDETFQSADPALEDLIRTEQLYRGPYFEEEGWIWALGRQQTIARKYQKVLEHIILIEMENEKKDNALYYIQKLASLDTFRNEDYYIAWVRNNISPEASSRLEALFAEDK